MGELTKVWLWCGIFTVVGLVIGWCYPSDYLRLSIGEDGLLNGVVQKRIDGIIPVWSRPVNGVLKAALVESGEDIALDFPSTIMLETTEGPVVYTHLAWVRAEQEVSRINRFIDDPGILVFSTWRVNWPFFLVSLFLILASVVYGVLQFWQSLQNSLL